MWKRRGLSVTNSSKIQSRLYGNIQVPSTGVGFKSTKKMAKNMPKIRTNVEFLHDEYKPVKPEERLEKTKVTNLGNGFVKVYIGDSKEG